MTAPVEIRRRLRLKPGDKVRFEDDGTTVRVVRQNVLSLDDVFGSVKSTNRAFTDEEIKEAVEKERGEYYRTKYERMGFHVSP